MNYSPQSSLHQLSLYHVFNYLDLPSITTLLMINKKFTHIISYINTLQVRHDHNKLVKHIPLPRTIYFSSIQTQIPSLIIPTSITSLYIDIDKIISYNDLHAILQNVTLNDLSFGFLNEPLTIECKKYVDVVVEFQPQLRSLSITKDLTFCHDYSPEYDVISLSKLHHLTHLKSFAYSSTFSNLPKLQTLDVFINDPRLFNSTIHELNKCSRLTKLLLRGDFEEFLSVVNITKLKNISTLDMSGCDYSLDPSILILSSLTNLTTVYLCGFFGVNESFLTTLQLPKLFDVSCELYFDNEIGADRTTLELIQTNLNQLPYKPINSIKPYLITIFNEDIELQATLVSTFLPHCYMDICIRSQVFDCLQLNHLKGLYDSIQNITFAWTRRIDNFNELKKAQILHTIAIRNSIYEFNELNQLTQLKNLIVSNGKLPLLNGLKLENLKCRNVNCENIDFIRNMPTLKSLIWDGRPIDVEILWELKPNSTFKIFMDITNISPDVISGLMKRNVYLESIGYEDSEFSEEFDEIVDEIINIDDEIIEEQENDIW
ncbi:F-box domain-containing protein [Entamoeba marina]